MPVGSDRAHGAGTGGNGVRRMVSPESRERWRFAPGHGGMSRPAVADGVVHVSSGPELYALDAATGQQRWSFATGHDRIRPLAPVVADSVVHFGSDDAKGVVYALDALTGRQLWKADTGAPVSSRAAVADGVVYIGNGNGLRALDATTGEQQWELTGGEVLGCPAVADGVVYAHVGGERDNKGLHAVDAATGERRWRFTTGREWNEASVPAMSGGTVFLSSGSSLYAVDAHDGRRKWEWRTGHYVTASPAVADGLVHCGSWDNHHYAVDAATGEPRWRFAADGAVASSAAVADGLVHFGSWDHHLYTVDAATGALRGKFPAGHRVGSPTVVGGVVYVGTFNGHLLALRSPTTEPERTRD
ncbi:PQQ-binding-like beta-propeller repeat protein [Streptomyces sp. NPDC050982]|uniref:outer membrane protein assembly factor BamB family protein n=1 Tax=Streptomyces sp. NPDC050982 TaxID=3154746 RepID=UPI0033C438F0